LRHFVIAAEVRFMKAKISVDGDLPNFPLWEPAKIGLFNRSEIFPVITSS